MTNLAYAPAPRPQRRPRPRHYLMTPPRTSRSSTRSTRGCTRVSTSTVSRAAAVAGLVGRLPPPRPPGRPASSRSRAAGHGVRGQRRPRHRDGHRRAPASPTRSARPRREAYASWLAAHGLGPVHVPEQVNEGEGDFLVVGRQDPRGHGLPHQSGRARRGRPAHRPARWSPSSWSTRATTTSTPRSPCSTTSTVAYFPEAFSPVAARRRWPPVPGRDHRHRADAAVLGLNAVSDGRHVVLAAAATDLAAQLAARGFVVVPVDLSELLKGGGGVKCCTLELRRPRSLIEQDVDGQCVTMRRRDRRHGRSHASRDRARGRPPRAQLPSAARGHRRGRGRLGHRRDGPPLSRLPGRLLGGQLRPPQPGRDRGGQGAARPGHPGQPRLLLRPARRVRRRAGRAVPARTWCCR